MTRKNVSAALAAAFALALPASAFAAPVSVPVTRLSRTVLLITPNDLKPPECASVTVTKLLVVTGTGGSVTGTSAAELILGGPNPDTLSGAAGDDCLLGGDGVDILDGGAGTDVCVGGPGLDVFIGCETAIQ
jgi:Ca2+-binding RTX toxin-like protein